MRKLKTLLAAGVVFVSVASADCCVVTKCWKESVKFVPYQVCQTVCVPVIDSCGNVLYYKSVKQYVTKYKKVIIKTPVPCCK